MKDFIWYVQAATDMTLARGYLPLGENGPDKLAFFQGLSVLAARIEKGEALTAADLPSEYEVVRSDPSRNLNLPMWHSSFVHVREDVAAVLRRFDLGQTVLAPIRIAMADDTGVNTEFCLLAVGNRKPTVDPEQSAPKKYGRMRWGPFRSDTGVDKTVVALRSVLEGPDIWRAPEVAESIFVSDRLGQALLAEEWGKKLKLRKVRVAEAKGA